MHKVMTPVESTCGKPRTGLPFFDRALAPRVRMRLLMSIVFALVNVPLCAGAVLEGEEPPVLTRSCATRLAAERAAPRPRSLRPARVTRFLMLAHDATRIQSPINELVRPLRPPAVGFRV